MRESPLMVSAAMPCRTQNLVPVKVELRLAPGVVRGSKTKYRIWFNEPFTGPFTALIVEDTSRGPIDYELPSDLIGKRLNVAVYETADVPDTKGILKFIEMGGSAVTIPKAESVRLPVVRRPLLAPNIHRPRSLVAWVIIQWHPDKPRKPPADAPVLTVTAAECVQSYIEEMDLLRNQLRCCKVQLCERIWASDYTTIHGGVLPFACYLDHRTQLPPSDPVLDQWLSYAGHRLGCNYDESVATFENAERTGLDRERAARMIAYYITGYSISTLYFTDEVRCDDGRPLVIDIFDPLRIRGSGDCEDHTRLMLMNFYNLWMVSQRSAVQPLLRAAAGYLKRSYMMVGLLGAVMTPKLEGEPEETGSEAQLPRAAHMWAVMIPSVTFDAWCSAGEPVAGPVRECGSLPPFLVCEGTGPLDPPAKEAATSPYSKELFQADQLLRQLDGLLADYPHYISPLAGDPDMPDMSPFYRIALTATALLPSPNEPDVLVPTSFEVCKRLSGGELERGVTWSEFISGDPAVHFLPQPPMSAKVQAACDPWLGCLVVEPPPVLPSSADMANLLNMVQLGPLPTEVTAEQAREIDALQREGWIPVDLNLTLAHLGNSLHRDMIRKHLDAIRRNSTKARIIAANTEVWDSVRGRDWTHWTGSIILTILLNPA